MGNRGLYITCQFLGWSAYVFMAFLLSKLSASGSAASAPTPPQFYYSLLTAFVLGITLSHLYREVIIRYDWLRLSILNIIPRFLLASVVLSILFELLYIGIGQFFIEGNFQLQIQEIIKAIAGRITLFLLWSLIYFFYHFFKNYKAEEIKNLKWEATKNEIELNKLKSQLNPHFMFNSMNTIRALIDENPKKAKLAVTQLSNILRSNLLMGKQKLIPIEQEIRLVEDYLAVEGYRYEERLKYELDVAPGTHGFLIPPLMLQTLVENGIKHGISKLSKGGKLSLLVTKDRDFLNIKIHNSGKYNPTNNSETGFGLENTRERLKILFGQNAELSINNYAKNEVLTQIRIPLKKLDNEN